MGGFFGIASKTDCVANLFYGTDYHSHLGTMRGGMATNGKNGFVRVIHDITNSQFRSKFEVDLERMHGNLGIGVISDYEDQPLIIGSHLGTYVIATVGRILNLDQLAAEAFRGRTTHFSEMGGAGINPTELVATIDQPRKQFCGGYSLRPRGDRGILFPLAAHRRRDLRCARPPGPHACGHRPQAECLCRHPGNLRLPEPRLRGRSLPWPWGDCADDARRRGDANPSQSRNANLRVSVGLLRLSGIVL